MTRTQAVTLAERLVTHGFRVTVDVFRDPSKPIGAPASFAVAGVLVDAGVNVSQGLQNVLNEAASRGLSARADLTVTVQDA